MLKNNIMEQIYRGLISNGTLSATYAVTEASSPSEAIQNIKDAGYRFSISESVFQDTDLRSYIKSKVGSGDYIWVGPRPHWW